MNRLEVIEQVVSCTNCELHKVGSGPIPFSGPKENPNGIAILGEAPGKQEDAKGEPFIGPAGQLLRKHLTETGITPERCFIINTASCWPDGTPKPEHVEACAGNRKVQLDFASPRWVLVLGKVAMNAVRPGLKISAARGRIFMQGNRIFMVTYHPAAALRKGTYEQQMRQDIELFLEVCKAGNDWSKFVAETCWECASDEVAWFDRDLVQWCEKHAPKAYHDRMAFIREDYEAACARLAAATTVEDLRPGGALSNSAPAESPARAGWARHDNPQTSHDTAKWMTEEHVTNLQWAVLWAHYKLGACTEAEARTFLNDKGIHTGNIDNVRRRRGEISGGERSDGTARPDWIVIDPGAGRGPTLDGQRLGASRYRCTELGAKVAADIDPVDLRRLLPLKEEETSG